MLRAVAILVMAVGLFAATAAEAAVHSKLDRGNEVRLTLDGRMLTATIVDLPRHEQNPTIQSELFGKPIRAACGTTFREPTRTTVVVTRQAWPVGTSLLSFGFKRDISRRAKWCLIEDDGPDGGGDLVFVSFRKREPARLLDKGRGPSGDWWRLSAWRGERLEPCIRLTSPDGALIRCFDDEAEAEAKLSMGIMTRWCAREVFVMGAVARSAATVAITPKGGETTMATLYRRPRGSRARAQYYLATFPGRHAEFEVEARDRHSKLIARQQDASSLRPDGPCRSRAGQAQVTLR